MYGLNGSGRCPSALTLERAKADCGVPGTDDMDKTHAHTVTGTTPAIIQPRPQQLSLTVRRGFMFVLSNAVPGAVAGWCDSFDRLGSKKVSLADVLKPAIELAEEGFPVRWAQIEQLPSLIGKIASDLGRGGKGASLVPPRSSQIF